jgi:hypothetical protein
MTREEIEEGVSGIAGSSSPYFSEIDGEPATTCVAPGAQKKRHLHERLPIAL